MSTYLDNYRDLRVGMAVEGPGPRPSAPRQMGTLRSIFRMQSARSIGYFAEVELPNGRTILTAAGLVTPAHSVKA